RLEAADSNFHYSAVRPLPYVHARSTGAITRRHFFVEHKQTQVPIFSVVGGKLPTMRSLAEQGAADVFQHWGRRPRLTSGDRPFPGSNDYPASEEALRERQQQIATRSGFSADSVAEAWKLCGTDCEAILTAAADHELLSGT